MVIKNKTITAFLSFLFISLSSVSQARYDSCRAVFVTAKKESVKGAGKTGLYSKRKNPGIAAAKQSSDSAIQKTAFINPEDVHVEKLGHNADTQSDIFQVKFTSANNKGIEFELEISSQFVLRLENTIDNLIKFGYIQASEVDYFKKSKNLLAKIRAIISKMPEEFQIGDKIGFDEFYSLVDEKIISEMFKEVLQNYNRHSNSKLSQIGPENVHIEKIQFDSGRKNNEEKYNLYKVQFKTQKGKTLSFNLEIDRNLDNYNKMSFSKLTVGIDRLTAIDFLDIKQKLQIAIGQMPAEIFKGLKFIKLQPSGVDAFGETSSYIRGSVIHSNKKLTETSVIYNRKLFDSVWFDDAPSRLINIPSVVNAYRRAILGNSIEMFLHISHLNSTPFETGEDLTYILAHELGHVFHWNKFSRLEPEKNWLDAIKKDGTSVSKYGDTNSAEDFAEAMRVYIQTDGGTKDPQVMKDFANRFEILDKLMKQSIKNEPLYLNNSYLHNITFGASIISLQFQYF